MMYRFNKGFTLVELLIVLVLIGLSSAIVLPSMWQQFDQIKFRSEVAKVKSLVSYSRHYSYFQGQPLTVQFKENQLIVSKQRDGQVLRTLNFATFTFSPETFKFDKHSRVRKNKLTIHKHKKEQQVELSV